MTSPNPRVAFFYRQVGQWRDEFARLRTIALDCGPAEELEWETPCYTLEKGNIPQATRQIRFTGYGDILHFSSARQSRTRKARIEKSIPQILDGKGLND